MTLIDTPGRSLTAAARTLVQRAVDVYADRPVVAGWLAGQIARLDEPLRIAVAGKVKAGKSTLLNALVGEQLAPADAGECTRVVTWYRDGPPPRGSRMIRRRRPARALTVDRRDGALVIDLRGTPADDVEHARGRLALARPADRHPDRHPGHRVAVGRGRAPHAPLPAPRRRAARPRPTPSST